MNPRLAYALAAALALGCGPAEERGAEHANHPIINGTDSTQGQFPTVVGLLLDAYTLDSKNPLQPRCVRATGACTSTLIREDVILTAAHCVTNLLKDLPAMDCNHDPDPPRYTLEPDLIAAAHAGRVIATAKAVAHPMFGPTQCTEPPSVSQWNDIALVFLKEPIKDAPVQRIPTPAEANALLKEGSKVRIVGYGKSKVDDDKTAGVMRWGTATLVHVGSSELQAGQMGEQQACQGDSGGPVFANPDGPVAELVQIGVTSRLRTQHCPGLLDLFNPPKCENGVFYTRVDVYADWIQQTIDKERPKPPSPPDLSQPDPPDLATPGQPPGDMQPEQGGCQCDVSGHPAPAAAPLLLLLMLLFGRLRHRARR